VTSPVTRASRCSVLGNLVELYEKMDTSYGYSAAAADIIPLGRLVASARAPVAHPDGGGGAGGARLASPAAV